MDIHKVRLKYDEYDAIALVIITYSAFIVGWTTALLLGVWLIGLPIEFTFKTFIGAALIVAALH